MKQPNILYFNGCNDYRNRLSVALRAAKICIYEVDLSRQFYTFFENAEDIFGIPDEEILAAVQLYSALPPEEYRKAVSAYFSHPDDADVIAKAFESILAGKHTTYHARMKAGQSKYIWCKLDVVPIMENGKPVRMIGVITDISDVKREHDRLEQKASLDGFTGLWNKEYSISAIKAVLEDEPQCRHALLLADIDDFKHFNDTYGHSAGDQIIAATARQFAGIFRKDDVVGRFGGDEFMIFVRDVRDLSQFQEQISHMTKVKMEPYTSVNSIGIAFYPNDGSCFEELFEQADHMLYREKAQKKHGKTGDKQTAVIRPAGEEEQYEKAKIEPLEKQI